MIIRPGVVILVCMAVVACAEGGRDSPIVVRDSSGVTIVESYEGLWGEGEGWQLAVEPEVTVGSEDGPEEYSLYDVRGAIRLDDGRIVVANSGTDELRFYDSTGSHLLSVGRDGFGPGEFKDIYGMWIAGDTLVIQDFGQDRVSLFSISGEHVETVMLHREPNTGPSVAAGTFSDGSILGGQFVFDRTTPRKEGMNFQQPDMALRRYTLDGAVLDSLGTFFVADLISEILDSKTDEATGVAYASSVTSSAPFGPHATWKAAGEHLYYGSSKSYEILVYGIQGTLERIIRRPIPNEPVTAADIDRFRDDFVDEDSRFASWQRRRVFELDFPGTKPAYGTIVVDKLENVWVSEYETAEDETFRDWTVFDAEGRMLGVVQVPRRMRVLEIGAEYVLGVWYTDLDVEQVRSHRFLREMSPRSSN